jgi:hypothetical protein
MKKNRRINSSIDFIIHDLENQDCSSESFFTRVR